MLRSTKILHKSSEIFRVILPISESSMNLAHIKCLSMLLGALCTVQTVCLSKLAAVYLCQSQTQGRTHLLGLWRALLSGRRGHQEQDGKAGAYPIDNNLAERTVRPFTTKRKCSLHFGSDEGVEMSAVYHSIISTLKLSGKSVWNFFGDFFRCEVLGSDTYKEYLPALTR